MGTRNRSALAAVAVMALTAAALPAQDVVYRMESDVEFGEAMGPMASMAQRMGQETRTTQTQYLHGGMLRTDQDGTSAILDAEGGRLIRLDHDARTYAVTTLDALSARMAEMSEMMQQMAPQMEEVQGELSVRVEPTGETAEVNGFAAERMKITMDMGATMAGMMAMMGGAQGGTAKLILDVWTSEEVPGYEAFEAFQQRQMEEFSAMAQAMGGGMGGMMGSQEAFARAREEMMKVEGIAVRTITYMVMVPEGETVELSALTRGETPYMMKTTTELTEASTESIDPSRFEIPGDYTEVDFFQERGRGMR